MSEKIYVGDGLYAEYDGFGFTLSASREDTDHWVYLEPEVIDSFLNFIRKSWNVEITVKKIIDPHPIAPA